MIKDKFLLAISILGVFILFVISRNLEPPLVSIKSLDYTYLEKQIKINGQIQDIQKAKSSQILILKDNSSTINIFVNYKTNLKVNSNITVIGKLTSYKNKLEITAEKIILS